MRKFGPSRPPTLLLGTGNPGKLRELQDLLAPLLTAAPLRLASLADLDIDINVPETGASYRENAALKARAYAGLSGLPCLSDDSGLEVDALGGAPGLYSARYSPLPGATDADRRARLLEQLEGLPGPWTAQFCCVVAVAFPDGEILFGEGRCPGEIIPQERGQGGFGYDPLFLLPSGRTMAELPEDEKNRLSHRALAVLDITPRLQSSF